MNRAAALSWLRRIFVGGPRAIRVALVAGVLSVALILLRQPMEADASQTMMSLGAGLVSDATAPDARSFRLNGAHLFLQTETRSEPLPTLLDEFEKDCTGETTGDAPPAVAFRGGDDRRGFVACALAGLDLQRPEALVAAARAYLAGGGDLGALGGLRFAYAEHRAGRSHVARFHAKDLTVGKTFPRSGDAPTDQEMPLSRPPGARRLLTASEEGKSYQVAVFTTKKLTPAQSAGQHRAELLASGFTVRERAGDGAGDLEQRITLVVEKADLFALVVAVPGEDGGTLTAVAISTGGSSADLQRLLQGTP